MLASNVIRGLMFGLVLSSAKAFCVTDVKASEFFQPGQQLELAEAAAVGDVARLDAVLAGGADVNVVGREGVTAAFFAVIHESKRGFRYLLEHGANPNVPTLRDGNSAMSMSAMLADPAYLSEAIKHGGDINFVNALNGRTPIFDAINHMRADNVKILIAGGANLNVLDKLGQTPVVAATAIQRFDLVYLMLEAGADPMTRTRAGDTVLDRIGRSQLPATAVQYPWKLKVIGLLKSKGLDVPPPR